MILTTDAAGHIATMAPAAGWPPALSIAAMLWVRTLRPAQSGALQAHIKKAAVLANAAFVVY